MKNRKLIISFVIGICILAFAAIGMFFYPDGLDGDEAVHPAADGHFRDENCPVVFTHKFTDLSKIDALQAIGSITGASPGRSYMAVKEGEMAPVYAPTDATLTFIIYSRRSGTGTGPAEYGFWFNAGCGVTFLFDHLDTISDELAKYAPAEPSSSTAVNENLSVPVKAGTLLGYSNGTEMARTFDFLVQNENANVFHANPERWSWDQAIHSVCPYDMFADGLKDEYYEKIGTYDNTGFRKAKGCGSPSHDIDGTISGSWFLGDSTDRKGEYVIIGSRYYWVDVVVKQDGENVFLRVTDYDPEVLPKDIKVGDSHCYFDTNIRGWAFMRLLDEKTMQFASGTGSCPAEFSSYGFKTYVR